ncbi:hypothetical protein [Cupriavidus gilardii]|uniref:hypothetical protein n=1 Tax=Cupriavidus gilardii TaxID=82541 RepID=UPI0021BEA0A1|nr:hypothetical protein [Cupriavidus gilardii]MCT9127498.1 hypothetical protein [Cupriavidus gilardii]
MISLFVVVILVGLCYLTCQRSTDIRNLPWSQADEAAGVIRFEPSKTEDNTGEPVDRPITPEIAAVLKRAQELRTSREVQKLGDDYVLTDMLASRRQRQLAGLGGAKRWRVLAEVRRTTPSRTFGQKP